jgi:hypothetical protein
LSCKQFICDDRQSIETEGIFYDQTIPIKTSLIKTKDSLHQIRLQINHSRWYNSENQYA